MRVNQLPMSAGQLPSVVANAGGGFVVVWTEQISRLGPVNTGPDIFAQRFDSGGQPSGTGFQVNSYRTGNQYAVGAAADRSGGFVAVWTDRNRDQSQTGIFGRHVTE